MNLFTRRIAATAILVALAALVALVAPPAARAQAPLQPQPQAQPPIATAGGTELFRALLDREGIRPVTLEEARRNPIGTPDLIVIAIGATDHVEFPNPLSAGGWIKTSINNNGAALLATDTPTNLNDMFGMNVGQVTGEIVHAKNPDFFPPFDDCPYVVPVSPKERLKAGEQPGRVWNLFRGLSRLTTNQPSCVSMTFFQNEYQYPLAKLPKSSFVKRGWGNGETPLANPIFAVGGDGQPPQWGFGVGYSFLAVADPSIYINQMLMQQGTENFEFALRTVEYLQGPNRQRRRCLFIENGRVIEKFDTLKQALNQQGKVQPDQMPNLGPLLEKNQDKLVDFGNRAADQLQNNDTLHNMLVGKEGSPEEQQKFSWWAERIAVVLAVIVTLMLLRRTLNSRASTNVPPPPSTGAGEASTGPPGVFDRRQKELVRRNNLYEPVRNLMREFFESIGGPTTSGAPVPRLIVDHRQVRKPESLRHAVRDMWRIAYGPPLYLSAQRWFELEPYFERLREAHAEGKWRFATDEEA